MPFHGFPLTVVVLRDAPRPQALRFDTTIEALDFHDNDVDDDGASALGHALAYNSTLKTLRLSNNAVTTKGATQVRERDCQREATSPAHLPLASMCPPPLL